MRLIKFKTDKNTVYLNLGSIMAITHEDDAKETIIWTGEKEFLKVPMGLFETLEYINNSEVFEK